MTGPAHMRRRSPTLSDPTPVIALHCSGAGAGQWRQLGEALDSRHELVAPEVITGNYRGAAVSFVDYWSGPGAWAALRPSVQAAMTRWMPKAPLDFRALIDEPTRENAYAGLRFPSLIIRGEHAPQPTRLIAETLPTLIPAARLAVIAGAGHMGPLTHAPEVNAAIARHIAESEAWIELAIPA